MLRTLGKLTWLEIKIFAREPLGLIGTALPVLVFPLAGRLAAGAGRTRRTAPAAFVADLPIFASLLIVISAVLSLVAIVAIYREGGILKRLRATPLHPLTILTAHVLVKLCATTATLGLMLLAGRRVFALSEATPLISYTAALLFTTAAVSTLGFVLASVVPTARFAQPLGTLIMYPMLGVSGLFAPVEALPVPLQTLSHGLPLTYAVSLLRGIWHGEGWRAHAGDAAALLLIAAICVAVAAVVFRWE